LPGRADEGFTSPRSAAARWELYHWLGQVG
jgi:hypothetical protein